MIIVTDSGFSSDQDADDDGIEFISSEEFRSMDKRHQSLVTGLELSVDEDIEYLLDAIATIDLIKIPFAGFADGRGFSQAKQLRLAGFKGILRASGHILADQYRHARRCGFDEVEISDELAKRQPEEIWLKFAKKSKTYQEALMKPRVA